MAYSVEITRAAAKQFRSLSVKDRDRLLEVVDDLAYVPRPAGAKILKGSGSLYRIRVGNYRIIYQIEESVRVVLVVTVGHRKDVYRKLNLG